jgi:4-hydroxy-4-methyl-2-oxoglutarate aldolase
VGAPDTDPVAATLPDDNGLGTSTVSDAMDRLGVTGQPVGLRPAGPANRVWGPAYTVRMAPAGTPPGTVGDFIDDVPAGSVVVIDNHGRLDATVWGDLLTTTACLRGVNGTVINGVCRDSWVLTERNYPMFTLAVHMRTGKDRVQLEAVQQTVSLAGVRVEPADLVIGDPDGVVVVPAARVADVLAVAAEISATEEAIRAEVLAGSSLRTARIRHSYHALQTRRPSGTGDDT